MKTLEVLCYVGAFVAAFVLILLKSVGLALGAFLGFFALGAIFAINAKMTTLIELLDPERDNEKVKPVSRWANAVGDMRRVWSMTAVEHERYEHLLTELRSQGATDEDAKKEAESTIGRERKEREANHKENDHE